MEGNANSLFFIDINDFMVEHTSSTNDCDIRIATVPMAKHAVQSICSSRSIMANCV